VLELEHQLSFEAEQAGDFFAALPARAGVCLIEPRAAGAQPFLIRTRDLRRRLTKLLGLLEAQSKRLNLREFAGAVRYRVTGSRFEQTLAYYQNAKTLHPARYRDLLRMRPPAVLKINLKNAYPRCFVTRRIPTNAEGAPIAGAYYGPFKKRKVAERFAEGVLDLFKVRRCQIKIRRDPTFPGCLYSEMKMCLAPCFAGCSQEEYGAEVGRLVQFLDTGGDSLRTALEKERETASEELDFEKASVLHKRVEKLDEALRGGPELARRVADINAVILQRGAEEQTIGVYAVRGGYIAEPLVMRFAEIASAPKSAEQMFREYLETSGPAETGTMSRAPTGGAEPVTGARGPKAAVVGARYIVPPGAVAPAEPRAPRDLSEHLWLLARWYYGKEREGEIFFREEAGRPGGWPYRRIIRACSRLLAAEAGTPGEKTPAKSPAAPTVGETPGENVAVTSIENLAEAAGAISAKPARRAPARRKKAPASAVDGTSDAAQQNLFDKLPGEGAK
jgi:excinuclease ABC subunit C